jgi:hypothetical protein
MLTLPLFAQMSRTELQNMYLTYLRGQNIEATIDGDGDIEFLYELPSFGRYPFYIIVKENNQTYFEIDVGFPIYSIETADMRIQAYMASIYATGIARTVKLYLNNAGTIVIASGEVFLASPRDFAFVFPKMMLEFDTAFDEFIYFIR